MAEVGTTLAGKYRLIRLLGDGGMGSVYEAEHVHLGTRVAVKVLHAALARRPGLIDRFLREARVAAQIQSANVVRVSDVDRTPEGEAYLVMELLVGEPLSALLGREGPLPAARALPIVRQMLAALEAAHSMGVVHRDLKPDNVFLSAGDAVPKVTLIDFGIAKVRSGEPGKKDLTSAGVLMGTVEYMAPEQGFSAGTVDQRADIYSVGVMLYEMLAGRRPILEEEPRAILLRAERGEVTPLVQAAPAVSPELAGIVHRAMAPRPELRFASARDLAVALAAVDGREVAGARGARSESPGPPRAGGTEPGAPLAGSPAPTTSFAAPLIASAQGPARTTDLGAPAPIVHAPAPLAAPAGRRAEPRRQSRLAARWVVVGVLALAIGAGSVVALVHGLDRVEAPATLDPWRAPAFDGASSARPTASPTAPADSARTPPLPSLGPPSTSPTAAPPQTARRDAPPAATDAPPLPPLLPSGFPSSFPSSLPFPFPSASAFPLPLPPFPPPPPQ